MTKNQKIALGCGGAGCLGLIVAVIAGVLIFYFSMGPSGRSTNFNSSTNRNSNDSRNTNRNGNSNDDSNDNGSASNENSSSSSSSMSDDDKHKLWQAASMTGDAELVRRVSVKLGLFGEDYSPREEYASFVKDHILWAVRNGEFIQSINTKEKAMAYVNEHFDE